MVIHSSILSILTLLVLLSSAAVAQTQARLFTVLGPTANCELIQAELDGLLIELANNPNEGGAIVTYGDRSDRLSGVFRESMIKRYLATRLFDFERVPLVRGEAGSEVKTEIWLIPVGVEGPPIARAEWSDDLSDLTKPIKVGSTAAGGLAGCDGYDFGMIAKYLKANPSMTAEAKIRETSTAKYRAGVKTLADILEEYGIPRNRLKSSYIRVRSGKFLESTEIWLVPGAPVPGMMRQIKAAPLPDRAPVLTDSSQAPNRPVPSVISGGVLNGKATVLPKPAYPAAARAVKASGAVNVAVRVDEEGNVESAEAVSGHPLLRAAAVAAARGAKFPKTMLSGVPVKVTGVLVFNFEP